MSLRDDCRDLAAPWVLQPKLRLALELLALERTFRPVPSNNDARKYLSSILVLTWAVLTIGFAAGVFGNPSVVFYGPLTAFVWALIGRMWGLEVQGLTGPIDMMTTNNDDDE